MCKLIDYIVLTFNVYTEMCYCQWEGNLFLI